MMEFPTKYQKKYISGTFSFVNFIRMVSLELLLATIVMFRSKSSNFNLSNSYGLILRGQVETDSYLNTEKLSNSHWWTISKYFHQIWCSKKIKLTDPPHANTNYFSNTKGKQFYDHWRRNVKILFDDPKRNIQKLSPNEWSWSKAKKELLCFGLIFKCWNLVTFNAFF